VPCIPVQVKAATGRLDFVDIVVSPQTPKEGETFTIKSRVRNYGQGRNFTFALYSIAYDEFGNPTVVRLKTKDLYIPEASEIPAGMLPEVSFTHSRAQKGQYEYAIFVDIGFSPKKQDVCQTSYTYKIV